ncbi:hypothetical protein CLV98_10568 [Dyadobacter jejuensis]|uniref:Uncharacterized protein n=1 Tax=Dyadobacter jejuensis TaxID=1082580 RepID=A0A316AKJ2_9BACT|nr:hypothetical protein CLV98_10568 [Dyadobacter jejuensis]
MAEAMKWKWLIVLYKTTGFAGFIYLKMGPVLCRSLVNHPSEER